MVNIVENAQNIRVRESGNIINDEDIPTVAELLFFGKNPEKYLKEAWVAFSYISRDDISIEYLNQKSIAGIISSMIGDTERFIDVYVSQRHVIKRFKLELCPNYQ